MTGGGKPHFIITSSRTPSGATRTTGATLFGNIAGIGGMLPARSRMAFTSSMMAFSLFVTL
jgi:hypothetical protein